jgi:hypothetical protein
MSVSTTVPGAFKIHRPVLATVDSIVPSSFKESVGLIFAADEYPTTTTGAVASSVVTYTVFDMERDPPTSKVVILIPWVLPTADVSKGVIRTEEDRRTNERSQATGSVRGIKKHSNSNLSSVMPAPGAKSES